MNYNNRKLNHEQRMLVFRMHAEGQTSNEIKHFLADKYKVTISVQGIDKTCRAKKNQPYIEEFRKQYLADIKKVPIANKRIRLNDKERVRRKMIDHIESIDLKKASKEVIGEPAGEIVNVCVPSLKEIIEFALSSIPVGSLIACIGSFVNATLGI